MMLQEAAHWVSGRLGRDNRVIRVLRPAYGWLLDIVTGGQGYRRLVNASEVFYVNPRWLGLFPETYEAAAYATIRSLVDQESTVLNVGAHVGIYALALGQWVGPRGRVFAFEPNPDTATIFEDHVRRNRLGDRVELLRMAVADHQGSATFVAAGVEGFSRLGSPHPERAGDASHQVRVPVTTIDAFCIQRGLRPDMIVMDIEGYEVAALAGARETFRAAAGRLHVVVELHPSLWLASGTSRNEMERLLHDLGVRPVALTGQADPLGQHGVVRLEWQRVDDGGDVAEQGA